MKLFILSLAFFVLNTPPTWHTNFQEAEQLAAKEHKFVLVNFSGSDWCIPCIKLEKQIFDADMFAHYADKNLVLVKADFPRLNKNRLSKEQTELNEKLASQYNPHGKFPYTLLIDENGKVVKEWDGLTTNSPDKFIAEVNTVVHAGN
ncbi:MAG: thioredoxin family protein [Chitinophagaceae bacterium]|nr:MAG: thioredoxin family protein [Chitinophagaceae bacterium]